jgi:hypothetical protein
MPLLAISLFGATVSGKEIAIVAVVAIVVIGIAAFALLRMRRTK